MGWVFTKKPNDVKQYLSAVMSHDREHTSCKVLEIKIVDVKTAYVALEHINKVTEARVVFAVVILLNYVRRKNDPYNFGYKDIDECMNPNEDKCPISILNLLTETAESGAIAWRSRCREYAAKVKPKVGQYLLLEQPIRFSNGLIASVFKVLRYGKRGVSYYSLEHRFECKISDLKSRSYTLQNDRPEMLASS